MRNSLESIIIFSSSSILGISIISIAWNINKCIKSKSKEAKTEIHFYLFMVFIAILNRLFLI